MLDWLEKKVRKNLGFSEEPISPTEMITEQEEGNPYTTLKGFVNREKEWQQMSSAEYYVDETFRRLRRIQYGIEDYVARIRRGSNLPLFLQLLPSTLSWKAEQKIAYGLLKNSQELTFSSHYIHDKNTTEVEGYFVCKQDQYIYHYPLTVYSNKSFQLYQQEEKQINAIDKESPFYQGEAEKPNADINISTSPFWGKHIIINQEFITPKNLEQALQKWYTEEFYYTHHHWTNCGKNVPKIVSDIEWNKE